jgi:hypothetical protein
MKGNCPSCKTKVVITSDKPESEWLAMSTGLKRAPPTKLRAREIISLIRDETTDGGAQLSNLSRPSDEMISLKDSHFYQYVEEVKAEKKRQRDKEKERQLAQITLEKKERAEVDRKRSEANRKVEEVTIVKKRLKKRRLYRKQAVNELKWIRRQLQKIKGLYYLFSLPWRWECDYSLQHEWIRL